MKRCNVCEADLPLAAFDAQADCADGRRPMCKTCRRAYNRETHRRRRSGEPGRRPVIAEGVKVCPACGEAKPTVEFAANRAASGGRGSYCKPCHNVITRLDREAKHGSTRNYHLKRRYGVTAAEVDDMIAAQGGVCALCHERAPKHVDHDHRTGAVRGVLCSCCNQGLGNFRDRADLLREAAAYLHRTTSQPFVVREQPGVYAVSPSVG